MRAVLRRPAVLYLGAQIGALLLGALGEAAAQEAPAADVRVLRTGGLRVETAALLWSGQQGGEVPLAVLAVPLPGAAEKTPVAVVVEAQGAALARLAGTSGDSGQPLRFDVAVYAIDGEGSLAGSVLETLEVAGTEALAGLERSGLRFVANLALRPGDYSLRVLVGDTPSRVLGLSTQPLAVPGPSGGEGGALLPPLFAGYGGPAGSGGPWLTVASLEAGKVALPAFWKAAPPPAARPLLRDGKEAAVRLPLLGAAAAGPAPTFEARKIGGGANVALRSRETGRQVQDGITLADFTFSLDDLAPGTWEISAVAGASDSPLRSPRLLVDVVADSETAVVWAERKVTEAVADLPAAPDAPTKNSRWKRSEAAALRAAFLKALIPLGQGDEAAARQAIAEFEVPLLTGEKPATRDDLEELEAVVVHDLKDRRPESLVPLLMLYASLHRDYQLRNLRQPTMHAAVMVSGLAEIYVKQTQTTASKQLAAGFLLSLIPQLSRGGLSGFIFQILHQALELDPDSEIALLCYAQQEERQGQYEEAVRYLQRLLDKHPQNAEAQLRLAIVTARQGNRKQARQMLVDLVARSAPPPAAAGAADTTGSAPPASPPAVAAANPVPQWVASLAYQELTRLQLAASDWNDADRTLSQGLAVQPSDEKLQLLRALAADLRGEEGKARDLLAPMTPEVRRDDTPRRRYNQLPEDSIGALWASLRESAAGRFPELAAAVTPSARKPGVR